MVHVILNILRYKFRGRLLRNKYFIIPVVLFCMIFISPNTPRVRNEYSIPYNNGSHSSYYICPMLTGGLGNSMFLYASAYGIARKTQRFMILGNNYLNSVFEMDGLLTDNGSCISVPELHSKHHCSYDGSIHNQIGDLNSSHLNYKVGDYLQSYKYFEDFEDDIRDMFVFREPLRKTAQEFLTEVARNHTRNHTHARESISFIGVHVRRGDIILKHYSEYGYAIPDAAYVLRAMSVMRSKFPNIAFVFSSNDMKWVKSNFRGSNVYYSGFTDPKLDLAMLASCNNSITTVGTYGWWSAYLAGGVTIYYKYPAREGSQLRKQFSSDYSDFFYPGWIGLK